MAYIFIRTSSDSGYGSPEIEMTDKPYRVWKLSKEMVIAY